MAAYSYLVSENMDIAIFDVMFSLKRWKINPPQHGVISKECT
jgi:hypothetical protein